MIIKLDEEKHIYTVDGVVKPGANEILKAVGLSKDWSAVDPFYRDRGTAVHAAIDLYLKGTLDESSLDPVIEPYFRQFEKWFNKIPEKAGLLMGEQPLYSKLHDFCGSVDLIMNGTIWDYKCSKRLDKDAERQYRRIGAAYRTLVKHHMGVTLPFKVLLLTGEGDAQVKDFDCNLAVWEAIMILYGDERANLQRK